MSDEAQRKLSEAYLAYRKDIEEGYGLCLRRNSRAVPTFATRKALREAKAAIEEERKLWKT